MVIKTLTAATGKEWRRLIRHTMLAEKAVTPTTTTALA